MSCRALPPWILLTTLGCPVASVPADPVAPSLDFTGMEDGALFVPYAARIAVSPPQPAGFTLQDGVLPDGLALREDGRIVGTPTWIGEAIATVRATTGRGAVVQGELRLLVGPGTQPVFPGFPRVPFPTPQGTTLLLDPWVRVAGGGEADQDWLTLELGWYLAGEDGVAEAGAGDDERVGDLGDEAAQVAVGQWIPSAETLADPPIYPSAHRSDGSPPTWEADERRFAAGSDTGRLSVTVMPLGFDPILTRLAVLPPDWCPAGSHPRGGPSPGVCE